MHPLPGTAASPILTSAHKIGIVGLGLIGGSLARRLVGRGRFVVGWNHTTAPYAAAQRAGIHTVDSLEELAQGKPDVLVLATPLKAMPEMLERLAPVLPKASTLTDVGSVKGPVREQVAAVGLSDRYVGGHPMTGNEHSGFAASDPNLFDSALWALCVDESTDYGRFLTVADMVIQGLGDQLICLDDGTHDRSAALISHMPHVVSTALAALLAGHPDRQVAAALAAGSWRDMTRVALTDPERTRAMVEEDRPNVAALLRELASRLDGVAAEMESGADLGPFFDSAQPFRDYRACQMEAKRTPDHELEEELILDGHGWREQLLDSARRGRRIVRFDSVHRAIEVSGPNW
ncbi:prephenate dehydrogenase [Bifidobacterium xylocopae]|uniref:Prephenate dehydrogenase n=1 Tax=Bifidobacterium xylocopae TaxID=2493119 RepID=A0A366KAL3_9BIFI|nr:prephenate dehydrogenase/arogenate dehydrogenase family protein [Bifidobacterium xylocopae]RBP98770.1 prephenate dehydrogenase [Bifidobacterium xylocopae]